MNSKDTGIVRELAEKYAELAATEVNHERRALWYRHNSFASERPMVVVESGDVIREFVKESELQCEDGWARNLEKMFKARIYHFTNVQDDTVIDPVMYLNWQVSTSDYGLEIPTHHGVDSSGQSLGYRWDPPMKDLEGDFEKLHCRTYTFNREGTLGYKAALEELLGGVLPIRIRGNFWWTMGLTQQVIYLRGLDNFMMDMYDNPEGVHRLMAFLRDDHLAYARWLEAESLLTLNNANDYIGSGSYGFTDLLPTRIMGEDEPVKLKDLWVLSESQETVGISPGMFEEFIAPYQREIAEEFGLVYYGCCEPVHGRWGSLEKFAHLHSVSISPWCDEEFMAEALGKRFVYSRKPSPTLISTGVFDEEAIRADIEKTLTLTKAKGCTVELIMKDVHNLNGDPTRLGRWVNMARRAIEKVW